MSRAALQTAWERIVAPSPALDDVGDRMRARLLASLLAVLVVGGLASGLVQLSIVPGFLPTFLAMLGALGVLGAAYAASRTRHYRAGGALAALAVLAACLAIPAWNPDDRVWYAFMSASVLLASVFLSLRAAAAFAALAVVSVIGVAALVPSLREPRKFVPPLMFQLVFSPLVLIAARHRDRMEEERRRVLLETQAALARSQRLETVGRLAGGVAHDFGNVLAVVAGSIAALRERPAPAAELDEMAEACARANALVKQLLAFARRQPLAPRRVAPADVIRGLEPILRRLVGVQVAVFLDLPAASAAVRADPTQLEQVLLNLVMNARDATPPGGSIRVGVRAVDLRPGAPETLDGLPAGSYCAIEVADTGHGMTDEVRSRLFEPFFTTKPAGSGFGLATVYGIVTQSGGQMTVRSSPGTGSTFTAFLPLADPPGPAG